MRVCNNEGVFWLCSVSDSHIINSIWTKLITGDAVKHVCT